MQNLFTLSLCFALLFAQPPHGHITLDKLSKKDEFLFEVYYNGRGFLCQIGPFHTFSQVYEECLGLLRMHSKSDNRP